MSTAHDMGTIEIPLTRGFTAVIDESDLPLVVGINWYAAVRGHVVYAARMIYQSKADRSQQYLHQLLTGWPKTDHIDGNGLNNCRSNLRPATQAQNQANQRAQQGRTSQYKGVGYRKAERKWIAKIGVGGRSVHLGLFSTEEAAAKAYDVAARRSFGEYAALNFPQPGERSAVNRCAKRAASTLERPS